MSAAAAKTVTTGRPRVGVVPVTRASWPGRLLVLRTATFVVFLLLWEAVCGAHLIAAGFLPYPTTVLGNFPRTIVYASTWRSVGDTMEGWGIGLLLVLGLGLFVGIILGLNRALYGSARFIIDFFRSTPTVAFLPILLLLYGSTLKMKVVLIVFGGIWIIILQTVHGVWDVDQVVIQTMRSYGLNRLQLIRWVVLPSVSAYVATGLRLASVHAFFLCIAAELLGGTPGLGYRMLILENTGGPNVVTQLFDIALVTVIVALCMSIGFRQLEQRLLFWHPAYRNR